MIPAIELRRLSKHYGPVRALNGISMTVEQGEIVGFLGPNGAGKTTTIRILLDLIRPTSGSAAVLGFDCQTQSLDARERMGYLPGDVRLYDNLTGRETLEYFARLRERRPDPGFVARLLERLEFDPTRRVGAYSKGNRQKLGLILAMMHRPQVLLLDEPTSGLDPLVQDRVADLLFELAGDGATVFFSSHVLSEVERMCHRAAFLREGTLIAIEEVAAVRARSLHIIEVVFDEPPPATAFRIPGVRETRRDNAALRLEVRDNLDAVLKEIARYRVVDLRTERPSLEDVFRAYYQEHAMPEAHAAS